MLKSHFLFLFFLLACSFGNPSRAAEINLHVSDVSGAGFSASGLGIHISGQGGELRVGWLQLGGQVWSDLRLTCRELSVESDAVTCGGGRLGDKLEGLPLKIVYRSSPLRLELDIGEQEDHSLIVFSSRAGQWSTSGRLGHFQLAWLASLLPKGAMQPTQGELSGTFNLVGDDRGISDLSASLAVSRAAFGDADGLHAGEEVDATVECNAFRQGGGLDWRMNGRWTKGEVFWQPFYLQAGYHVEGAGRFADGGFAVSRLVVRHPEIGELQARMAGKQGLETLSLRGEGLRLARLFNDWGKPLLAQTKFSQAKLSGEADIDWRYEQGQTRALSLRLKHVDMQDGQAHFALHDLNGELPWSADAATVANLSMRSGELLQIPLGEVSTTVEMRGMAFSMPELSIPIWDGKMTLRDVHVHQEDGSWHAGLSGNLTPVSMRVLSLAFGWPEMSGSLSGMIPQVSYRDGRIGMDGALLFQVFDGTVVASHLALEDAFGPAPRLSGELDMRELDLDMLTHTFSFGSMQGRLDASVHGLRLENWQPVSFDARVASSPGSYKRKISQRAVENITALGGGGATAAMQRWYLQMFKEFGYERIGLSCVLRNRVCRMDGVEPVDGGYTIIKGGGVPAINVIGYNHNVGWQELLSRLKRVLDNNARPVIK